MRKSDCKEKIHFRTEGRLIHLNGSWYFLAREGERGPYPSSEKAKIALERFVTESIWLEEQKVSKLTVQTNKLTVNPKAWDNRPDAFRD
ncbi:MAG: hypothetical protein KUG75_05045 [Pseudomonadales bacterium]|nr:hypothetical protein [Pseudomonadales bacterium]